MKKLFYLSLIIIGILILTGCFHEHTFNEANCTTPKTCSGCGLTEGNALGHSWKNATCTSPKTCGTCGITEGGSLGHNWKNATCTAPKTCSRCSVTSGSSLGHSWKSATCTSPKKCSRCSTTSGSSLGHSLSNGFCTRCSYTSLKLSNILSAPIEDEQSIQVLSRDRYTYYIKNVASYYNSANGLYLAWGATNNSSKTIKYLTFTAEFYNAVGDPARDSITGKTYKTIQSIGPINSGESFYFRKIIGYSTSCSSIKITNITIEYMDGTKITGTYNYSTHHKPYTENAPEIYVTGYIK